MQLILKLLVLLSSLAGMASHAALLSGEVAQDAYVSVGGYDLAWASPCSDGLLENSCGAIDLSEQAAYGWQVMTSDLFASLGISAETFVVDYSSENTQTYDGQSYAKASGWFSNSHSHIDVGDGINGNWSFADVAEVYSTLETIVYRAQAVSVSEPSSMALLGLGLFALSRRSRSTF